MARALPVTLSASIRPIEETPSSFHVDALGGQLKVRGYLTAGSSGWTLRCDAACRRSTITVHVTAVETSTQRTPDLEHHQYEATIEVRRPGRYSLRVAHAYVLRGEPGAALPNPVFERTLNVP